MKSVLIYALIVIALWSTSLDAQTWLRPDTQEPRCLSKNEEKLAACLQACDKKPDSIASLCRRQCLDAQESAKKACNNKPPVEIQLPGK